MKNLKLGLKMKPRNTEIEKISVYKIVGLNLLAFDSIVAERYGKKARIYFEIMKMNGKKKKYWIETSAEMIVKKVMMINRFFSQWRKERDMSWLMVVFRNGKKLDLKFWKDEEWSG